MKSGPRCQGRMAVVRCKFEKRRCSPAPALRRTGMIRESYHDVTRRISLVHVCIRKEGP